MSDDTHSPTPWTIDRTHNLRGSDGTLIAKIGKINRANNEAFILRACNSIGVVVDALEEIMSILYLVKRPDTAGVVAAMRNADKALLLAKGGTR